MEDTIIQNQIIQNNTVFIEGMTSISALISSLDSSKARRNIIEILFAKSKISSKKRELSFLKVKASAHGCAINFVDSTVIDKVSNGTTHGGIIAVCTKESIPSLSTEKIKNDGVYYMFEGIEDPYNFGYVIRSLYASGADGIIVSPRNWFSAASVVARSSAGTSELIDTFVCEPTEAVDIFKSLGYTIVCAGIRDSVSLYEAELKKPLFVIIGGEKRGISRAILNKADTTIRIDYGKEFKGSLPTVAATSIICFEILRKNSNN